MRKIIDNYILPIFILTFCIVIVKFSAVVSYAYDASSGDYRYGGYTDQTTGRISSSAVYSMSQWESILSGLTVGKNVWHSSNNSVSAGVGFISVSGGVKAYDYFDFSHGYPIISVTGFSLVSYNTQYYMVKFTGVCGINEMLLAPGENRHFEPGENNQFQPGRNRQSVPGGCSQPRFECRF